MKKLSIAAVLAVLVLAAGAAAFQIGKHRGFKSGSEWALVQADIVAREAGLFMPVYLEGDTFRIVFKQPPGLYRKSWELADRHEGSGKPVQESNSGI